MTTAAAPSRAGAWGTAVKTTLASRISGALLAPALVTALLLSLLVVLLVVRGAGAEVSAAAGPGTQAKAAPDAWTGQPALVAAWTRAQAYSRALRPRAAAALLHDILRVAPEAPSVHAQMGLAQFQARNLAAAAHHFERAREGPLSPDERRAVDAFLERIAQARAWSFSFAISPLYERNPAQRTQADTILIGGIPFVLDDRAEPSFGLRTRVGAASFHLLAPDVAVVSATSLDLRMFRDRRLDDVVLRGRIGLAFLGDMRRETGVGVVAMRRWIVRSGFSREAGPYLSHARQLGPDTAGSGQVEHVLVRHDSLRARDGQRTRARLDLRHRIDDRHRLRAGAHVARIQARQPREAGWEYGLSAGWSFRQPGGIVVSGDAMATVDRRSGVSPLIGARRRDRTTALQLDIAHEAIVLRGFTPALVLRTERRRSNLPVANFRNSSLSVSAIRQF